MDSKKPSARRAIYEQRASCVRQHIKEPRVRECQTDVHGSLSPRRGAVTRVHGSRTSLESCTARVDRNCARVGRDCTRLHTSWTRVYIDIPLMS